MWRGSWELPGDGDGDGRPRLFEEVPGRSFNRASRAQNISELEAALHSTPSTKSTQSPTTPQPLRAAHRYRAQPSAPSLLPGSFWTGVPTPEAVRAVPGFDERQERARWREHLPVGDQDGAFVTAVRPWGVFVRPPTSHGAVATPPSPLPPLPFPPSSPPPVHQDSCSLLRKTSPPSGGLFGCMRTTVVNESMTRHRKFLAA